MITTLRSALVVATAALNTSAMAASVSGGSSIVWGETTHAASNLIRASAGTTIDYVVKGWGTGTNVLKVDIQQYNSASGFVTMKTYTFEMSGTGASRSIRFFYGVDDVRAHSTEEVVRLNFRKSALTNQIDFWWQGTY